MGFRKIVLEPAEELAAVKAAGKAVARALGKTTAEDGFPVQKCGDFRFAAFAPKSEESAKSGAIVRKYKDGDREAKPELSLYVNFFGLSGVDVAEMITD